MIASVGDPAEQLERHDRHLELADPGDRRRALVDLDRDDEVRDAGLAADVADEAVVEEVLLPVALAAARVGSQIWAVPVLPPTS